MPQAENKPFLREGTSDRVVWRQVFLENEYLLGDVRGKTIVDVGANIGAFSRLVALKGAKRVIALEPYPANAAICRGNTEDLPAVKVVEKALHSDSTSVLNAYSEEELREAQARSHPNANDVNFGGVHIGGYIPGSISMHTISFTDLLKKYRLRQIDLLKIDCESGEWPFFKAVSAEDLAPVQEIICEIHLFGNINQIEEPNPVNWLKVKLQNAGFTVFIRPTNKDILYWFYAFRPGMTSVERSIIAFERIGGVEWRLKKAEADLVQFKSKEQ